MGTGALSLVVAVEPPGQEAVAALLRLSDEIAASLYPGEPRRGLNPATLAGPGIHLLVAREDGVALGCCAVFEAPDGTAELKRMVVHPAARGQGAGLALLGRPRRWRARSPARRCGWKSVS